MNKVAFIGLLAMCVSVCSGCGSSTEVDHECIFDSDCEGSDVCHDGHCMLEELCGNGKIDLGESCDGDCPISCDDGDGCTVDSLNGSAESCTAECFTGSVLVR